MKINTKKIVLIISLTLITMLSGCGGGGSNETITDPMNLQQSEETIPETTQVLINEETQTIPTLKSKELIITSIEDINTNESSTVIKWELNKNATGQIEYGLDNDFGEFSVKEESFDWNVHTIKLKNLQPSSTYYYRVISEDPKGNKIISETNTFTTADSVDINLPIPTNQVNTESKPAVEAVTVAEPTHEPVIEPTTATEPVAVTATETQSIKLEILSVEDLNTNEDSTVIKWELNNFATGQVEYGFDENYGEFSVKEESFDWDTHTLKLQNLEPSTTYHYKVISADNNGNEITSEDKTFTTTAVSNIDPAPAPVKVSDPSPEIAVTAEQVQTDTRTGSAKTNWGFQPFTVPNNSVTVQAGGNIQDAINSLPNGGTVKLAAGTFYANRVHLKSNMVLEGAGRGQTIIKFTGTPGTYLINVTGGATQNAIIRNLTVNATGNGSANGVEITYGANNVLVENIEIFGAGKSNLLVWNPSGQLSKHVTFKDVISHHSGIHGMSMYHVKGGVFDNCESYATKGYGFDVAAVTYAEVSNSYSHDNDMGSKYPGSTYVYLHDNRFENNKLIGIKFGKRTGTQYWHIENNSVINCVAGVMDWGDAYATPTFEELVIIGNTLSGNNKNNIYIRGGVEIYEYGTNIGITKARAGVVDPIHRTTGTPASDAVGYKSWPSFN